MAENLLKNSNFSEKSPVDLPLYWEFRGATLSGLVANDNYLKLGGGKSGEGIYLIQRALPLTGGVKYNLSYKVKSSKKSQCRVYCEWTRNNNGKTDWHSSETGFHVAGEQWQTHETSFEYRTDSAPAYLAINVKDEGEVEFKDLFLEADRSNLLDKSKLLVNGNFEIRDHDNRPLGWELRGKSESVKYKDGGVFLKGSNGQDILLIQHKLPLQSGVSYQVSYEAKGPSVNGEYRVYFETIQIIDGKSVWQSFATAFNHPSLQWERKNFVFAFPEKVSSCHLVIAVKGGTDAEFRNIEVNAVKEEAAKEQLGGKWYLHSDSVFTQNAGQEVLSVKQNKTSWLGIGATLKGVPLEVGKKYTLSYAVIGAGNAGNTTGFHPFRIQVAFDGVKEKVASSWDDVWNNSFQNKQFSFEAPVNASSGKTNIELVVTGGGAVCFSNIKLEKAEIAQAEKYNIRLEQPCYRNMIFSSMAVSEIKGKIQTDPSIRTVKISLKSDNKILYSSDLQNQGKSVDFSIPVEGISAGKYQLEAVLSDTKGIVATTCAEIIKLPPAPMEVVQGSDRNFYINGKAFFPIAFWDIVGIGKNENPTMYYAARQGVNLHIKLASDETSALEILNTAEKNGIKVMLGTSFAENIDGEHLKMWKHRIANMLTRKVTEHPALFGYSLADEPSWTGVPLKKLTASYQALKELDPYHPVWINAAPRGPIEEHMEYSKAADIYGVDIYPVPYPAHHSALEDKGLTSVGKYAQRMYEAVDARKAIWMALQGFSWQEMDGKVKGTGYPTYIESRFMAYDALLNNANSIGYWGTQYILTPGFYDTLFKVTREIRDISGLLAYGKIVEDAMADTSLIKCREFDVNGKKYLIALNNSVNSLTAKISGKFSSQELQVFQENRTVTVNDGKFTDSFKPFEVHVYAEGELPPPVNALPPANPELDKQGNPFYKSIERRLKTVLYDGKANWIWEKSNINVAGSKVWLLKEFMIDKAVKSAKLLICADDLSTVYLNGQLLGHADGWELMELFDCANIVKNGNNMLSVTAADVGQLPCGLLADLTIETVDGKIISIVSDETWRASDKAMPDWLNPAAVQNWGMAKTVAPYGGGHWGKRVQLP